MAIKFENLDDTLKHRSCLITEKTRNDFDNVIKEAIRPLTQNPPRVLVFVEIGTHFGLSALFLAKYGFVYTYDIKDNPERFSIWHPGDTGRIKFTQVKDFVRERDLPSHFDVAFIDGSHKYHDVKRDFKTVNSCGTVIFDDYNENHLGVLKFASRLPEGVKKYGRFGLWRAKNRKGHHERF